MGGQAGQPLSPLPPAGTALQCYSCQAEVSNEDCLHVQNCSRSETECWTERIREWPCCPRRPPCALPCPRHRPLNSVPLPPFGRDSREPEISPFNRTVHPSAHPSARLLSPVHTVQCSSSHPLCPHPSFIHPAPHPHIPPCMPPPLIPHPSIPPAPPHPPHPSSVPQPQLLIHPPTLHPSLPHSITRPSISPGLPIRHSSIQPCIHSAIVEKARPCPHPACSLEVDPG